MKKQFIQYMYSYPHKTAYQHAEKFELPTELRDLSGQNISLYMHIPFCDSKCGYCNLFSIPSGNQILIDNYISAINRQNKQYQNYFELKNINCENFILGGGTPTQLSIEQLDKLFTIAEKDYGFDLEKGFSVIETSPNQTTAEKLSYLKSKHVKRISMGIQSFVQSELNTLERQHSAKMAESALHTIQMFDFPIVNIDLIYGIPGQTMETLIYSAFKAIKYQPEEIFVYPLYSQANTRIGAKYKVDESYQSTLYNGLKAYLEANGYHSLSMRRFAKTLPSNSTSCGFENTISLGCGGRSYVDNYHFCEPYTAEPKACRNSLNQYIDKTDFLADISFYNLDTAELKRRYIIKNLLNYNGIDLLDYQLHFQDNILDIFPQLLVFKEKGWISITNELITLTAEGMTWSDFMGPSFISEEVNAKMKACDSNVY